MKHGAKQPEIRRQELIDIALRLFLEHGYENVSVTDILEEIRGQRGMFYHYFKNKQDIYSAAMEQYIKTIVRGYLDVLQNQSLSLSQKLWQFLAQAQANIQTYADTLLSPDNAAQIMFISHQVLHELAAPLARTLVQAVETGEIPPTAFVNRDNAYESALFLINGCHSLIEEQYLHSTEQISMELPSQFIAYFLGLPS